MNKSRFVYDENGKSRQRSWGQLNAEDSTFSQDLFDPKKLISLVQRHVWSILLFSILSVSATYYIVNNYLLPVYQSQGTLIVTTNESSLPGSDGVRGGEGSGVGDIVSRSFTSNFGNPVQNAIYLFQSRDLSDEVAKDLVDLFDSTNYRQYPSLWVNFPEDSTTTSIAQVSSRIRNRLSVKTVEQTGERFEPNLLEISYQSYSPEEAASIVNSALDAFLEKSLEQKQNSAINALSFLQEKKEEAKKELDDAEERLISFRNENQLVAIDDQASNSVNSLSELQAEKQSLEIRLESVNTSIENYENQIEAIKPGLKDQYTKAIGPTITRFQNRLAELRTRRFVILSRNPQLKDNPNSEPELKKLNQQIAGIEEEIASLSEGLLNDSQGFTDTGDGNLAQELSNIRQNLIQLRLEKNQFESQIQVLDERIKDAETFLGSYPDKQVKLARLETEVQRHKQLLSNLISQESEIALWQQTQNSSGTIVDRANPRFSPVKPNKILWLGFAAMVGVALPIAVLILKTSFSSIINSSEQLSSFSYPLLSVIYDHSLVKANNWLTIKNKDLKDSNILKSLVFYHNNDTPVAETYRKIVSQILYTNPDYVPQSILVTSSGKGEGKTTLITNLAAALAEVDKKVLIIDCDFRRPAVHKIFSLDNLLGIKEVLFDGGKLSDAIKDTGIQNLSVLTTGAIPSSPAKLLASEKFKEMIKVVRPNFDIILFDTPPQGLVSDVASLLNLTDLVIVVAKFGETNKTVLSHTLKELDKNENSNLSLVLTAYKPDKSYDSYDTKELHTYRYSKYYEYEK